jgi:hypothetical protein
MDTSTTKASPLTGRTTRLVVFTLLLMAAQTLAFGLIRPNARFFVLTVWEIVLVYAVYLAFTRDRLLAHIMLVPLLANLPQLLVDWFHVQYAQTLVYDFAFFKVWETPDYILAGWLATFTQWGYLTLWLKERIGRWPAIGIMTVFGASLHVWYEELAFRNGGWHYTNASMFGHVSIWVIIAFFFILGTLSWLFTQLEGRRTRDWVVGGLLMGIAILFYSVVSVLLFR